MPANLDRNRNGSQLLDQSGHREDPLGGLQGLLVTTQFTIVVDDEVVLLGTAGDGQPGGGCAAQVRGLHFQGQAERRSLEDLAQQFGRSPKIPASSAAAKWSTR